MNMNVKIFVLGRPGSGKSTAARYLNRIFQELGWCTKHINDYNILRQMFLDDTEHRLFRPTPNNGFDAIDFGVLDTALQRVEQQARECSPTPDLITIEFARDDYREALHTFSPGFIQNSYILFMHADLETCLHRVHERVTRSKGTDDHPSFSDEIFRQYYAHDQRTYMQHMARREFALQKHIQVIDNTGPLNKCLHEVDRFAHYVWQQEMIVTTPVIA